MARLLALLSLAAWLSAPAPAVAAESADAAIAAAIAASDRSSADRERDARDKPAETLRLLGLAPGMKVIDVFSGGGYYAELAARVVGAEGKVWAHNNAAYLGFSGKALAERLAARPLPQLARYDREIGAFDLPAGSIDAAILVMAYHDVYWVEKDWTVKRDPLFAELKRVLREGGRVLVVDHHAASGTGKSAVQELHRIDEAFVREDFASAGLRLVSSSDALRNPADDRQKSVFDPVIRGKTDRFVLVFEKPVAPAL